MHFCGCCGDIRFDFWLTELTKCVQGQQSRLKLWTMIMIRKLVQFYFLTSIFTDTLVDGAQCQKSSIGRWTCSPCGKGSRCHYCTWCTGYCYNGHGHGQARKNPEGIEYGSAEALYKLPYLEMFNDIVALLKGGGISDLDVVELYKITSVATREDCTICNNSPELNSLSSFTDKVHMELEKLIGTFQFKQKAIEKTTETKNIVQNLPETLKIKVEPKSSILESVKKGRVDLILRIMSFD